MGGFFVSYAILILSRQLFNISMLKYFVVSFLALTFSNALSAETFRFCYERWKPFSYLNDQGQYVGESIDLVKRAIAQSNITVSFKELPFARCIAAVTAGQFDFVLHSDKNEALPFVPVPINDWKITLVFHQDSKLNNDNLLPNTKVMLSWDYQYPDEVMQYLVSNDARLVKTKYYAKDDKSTRLLFQHLVLKRVDAMLVDRAWAEYKIKHLGLPLRISPDDVYIEPQFVGYYPNGEAKAKRLERLLRQALENK